MINFEWVTSKKLRDILLSNNCSKKQIVSLKITLGIWPLFALIRFEIDRIVSDRMNTAVTYS